jgi:hypothetical protein
LKCLDDDGNNEEYAEYNVTAWFNKSAGKRENTQKINQIDQNVSRGDSLAEAHVIPSSQYIDTNLPTITNERLSINRTL